MERLFENIIERINLKESEYLKNLLKNSIKRFKEDKPDIYFGIVTFLQGSSTLRNGSYQNNNKYETELFAFKVVCDELGFALEDEECFVLFHLRNLGKFKIKEDKLLQELKTLWKEYPKYAMEDRELTYSLKELKKLKFISYRRSTIQISNGLSVIYK